MPQSSTNPPTADYGATASPVPVPVPSSSKPSSGSRIEPKVWLANERTWLNWCRTGVLLGSFGVALINSSPSLGARAMGVIYATIAIGTIGYGHFLYKKRIRLIKEKYAGHFDDVIAPLIISGSLFLAILVNFILRAIDNERHKPSNDVPKVPWIAAPASTKFPPL
ncbi:hypothetical protein PCANC_06099 [Puccinia coronata f. sp. avenae]|uniref:DUF202 domain-containing protein n=1 Tax=Puccinia coronata f. sp. avenae TaxID=200324 RepID=A0A2N5SWS8_9BASI|nr:hypothetical protein PCASD_22411 [Puccinia coronata f. sp. avenae]PLW17691.1 hypothetical protein PCANC_10863 [Puccinia coronata f. sp. avenae]PLW38360.1 hypothetical protein PCASD_10576 [Puccinia coronata f. sp. avenae]PLW53403.1 hypothetical protein PCANC_06099 [Puccinia coronata f. sp. avenae]